MVDSTLPKADEHRHTPWRGYVTLLFADLCDYTGLGEQHDPEEIDELRFRLEQLAGRVIERHGGSVSQIYGDGILAVFGFSIPAIFFAGQMSGVEGYVESAASGLLAGLNAVALATGRPTSAPPRTTAIGALAYYASHANPAHYEPSNITFGIMEPLVKPPRGKMDRKVAMATRALEALASWMQDRAA